MSTELRKLALRTFSLAAVHLSLLVARGGAVMPTPDVLDQLKRAGTFDEYVRVTESARRRGMDQPEAERLTATAPPVLGLKKALVILVDFSDHPASAGAVTDTTFFRNLLFSTNDPAKSLNDFYTENSYGKMSVTGDVVGWLRMPQTYAYYTDGQRGLGSPPMNAQQLAADAVLAANVAGVDFSKYDNDGNGQLDGFFVVHSGPGYEETGNVNDIHSHKWTLTSPINVDGVQVYNYTMQPEERGNLTPVNIGVFCHEFGHFFGLPDLYDVDGSSQGLDKWSLMAAGNYARTDGSSPSHFCAWCKIQLGWLTPVVVTSNLTGASIPQAETDSVVYKLWTGGVVGNQYYLVENRQKTKFDTYLPGGGLLIYRVDDNLGGSAPNNNEWYPGHTSSGHYKVALEQADGLWELEKSSGTGPLAADNGDPWPGSTANTSFDDLSVPDTRDYNLGATQVAVWDISASGSLMTANLDVTWSRPNFQLQSCQFVDNGDADGTPDPGEQVNMFVRHYNPWQGVASAQLRVATDDADILFADSVVSLGAVASGDTSLNVQPIRFSVPAGKAPRITDFYIAVEANGGAYQVTDTVRVDIGPKQILVVDDDGHLGGQSSYDSTFILPVLETRRSPHARWEVFTSGTPTTLQNYPAVIWYTGNRRAPLFGGSDSLISPSEAAAIRSYLSSGGHLFITGQQIARYLDSLDRGLLADYLHAAYAGAANDFMAFGVSGDVISDSTQYVLGGAGGAGNQLEKDLVNPIGSAVPIFTETDPAAVTGIRFDSSYKVVFLGWGVEGIGDDVQGLGALPKSVLINRTLDWMLQSPTDVPDAKTGLRPEGFMLQANYPNPFNPTTTIEFTRQGGPAHVRLVVFNLLGRQVRQLADGVFEAGVHRFTWDGRDQSGRPVGSGVYLYRLESAGLSESRKMLLLK
jgi:M6 family metalloprotease-like protein